LRSHGIGGTVLNWVQNWLYDRKQKVRLNQNLSDSTVVTSGVPQGSVLGPILFIIYINDLDCELISKIGKFADDTKMCKSVNNIADMKELQDDLNKLEDWSKDWQMQFNVDKCVVVHMGKKNQQHNYRLGNHNLKKASEERDLGVIMGNSGKFSEQCSAVMKSANCTLGMIKRHITCKSKNIIIRLYKALVRPKIEYCVQPWRPFLKKDIEKLERIQHGATKMI